jgi:hypothetical protein
MGKAIHQVLTLNSDAAALNTRASQLDERSLVAA